MSNEQISKLFQQARADHNMSLRDFGKALGISHQQVKNIEDGKDDPTRENVYSWIESETVWINTLGLQIFNLNYGPVIQNILVPSVKRVISTQPNTAQT